MFSFWPKNKDAQFDSGHGAVSNIEQSRRRDFCRIAEFALNSNSEIVFWTDVEGNFLNVNDATCEALGYSRAALETMKLSDIDPEISVESHQAMLGCLEENPSSHIQSRPIRKDGFQITIDFTVKRLVIDGRVYLCAFGREIQLDEPYLRQVLDSIATGRPLKETLQLIVELAEKTRSGMVGSILLMDDANLLRTGGASTQLSQSYCQQIDGLEPGPSAGSCGTAAYTGKSVMVEDVFASPLWTDFVELAKREGIRACWSVPIFSSTKAVIGTAAMYFRDVTVPTEVDRELMKSFARMAGIAIERSLEMRKLRRSELRFRSLIQSAAATVWTTDPKGGFVDYQESWENYTGQSWEEHRGYGWTRMIHPDDRNRLSEIWTCSIETHSICRSFGRIWHAKTSGYRHFEVQAVPVFVDGELVEWSGFTIDVHDREMAEEAVQQNERRLRIIANSLPICIGQIDNEYRYQFNNAMYETFYGKLVTEIRGRTVREVFGESAFVSSKPHIDAALEGKQVIFEQQHIGKDLIARIGETRLVPNRNADGTVIGVFVLTDDITERRALEKEVLNVSVQQQLSMGQDLHDGIGQELTGLGMIADTVVLALRQSNSEEEYIATKLANGIKRALGQVKLLARGLNPVDVAPGGFCSALVEMASHVEALYGIKCVVNCAADIGFDDNQVSINLFRIAQEATTNAAKHGRADCVEIDFGRNGDLIELSIVDDGCGFDVRQQQRSGMGLRTIEYRAGLIGAQIQITSDEGQGTSVICQVPSNDTQELSHEPAQIRHSLHTHSENIDHET